MDHRVHESAQSIQPASLIQEDFIKGDPAPTFRAVPITYLPD